MNKDKRLVRAKKKAKLGRIFRSNPNDPRVKFMVTSRPLKKEKSKEGSVNAETPDMNGGTCDPTV